MWNRAMHRMAYTMVFVFGITAGSRGQSLWKTQFYDQYSTANYTLFPAFDQKIDTLKFDWALLNAAIFYETNRQRGLYALKPLKYDARLEKAAQGHSNDMVAHHFFSHHSPVAGKYSVADRTRQYGITTSYVGENLHDNSLFKFNGDYYIPPSYAGSFQTTTGEPIPMHTYQSLAIEVVKGWMNSPGHKDNILNSNYTHLGVGNAMHYFGTGIDRIPWVKSTQNFAMLPTNVLSKSQFTSKSSVRSTTQPQLVVAEAQKSGSLANPMVQKSTSPTKQAGELTFGGGYMVVFQSPDDIANKQFESYIHLFLGGSWGRRRHFAGIFPTVELGNTQRIGCEAGGVIARFLRLSLGASYCMQPIGMADIRRVMPSGTAELQLRAGFLYLGIGVKGTYANNSVTPGIHIAAGIRF